MPRSLHRPKSKTRIFLLDAEPMVRRGLELLMSRQADLEICGAAGSVEGALAKILTLKPDLAVVGLTLRSARGLKLIRRLRRFCPHVKILVFSMEDRLSFVKMALAAGADRFVAKQDGSEKMLAAVQGLVSGRLNVVPVLRLRKTEAQRPVI